VSQPIITERHPLKPFLPEGAWLLMLGSFPPSRKRWCMDFYYPNFTNDMWRVMGLVGFADRDRFVDAEARRFRMDEIVGFLEERGIAIYDTATAVRRLNNTASDKDLEVVEPTDIASLLSRLPSCTDIAATGEKAATIAAGQLGARMPRVGEFTEGTANGRTLRLWRMPSTSRAYPLAIDKKAEAYRRLLASRRG